MMSGDLAVTTRASDFVRLGTCAMHGLALLAVWFSALPWWLCGLLTVGLWFALRKTLTLVGAPVNLRYTRGQGWQIGDSLGAYQTLTLLPTTVVFPGMIVMHCSLPDRSMRSLIICRDSVSPVEYRHLVIALKVAH